MKPEEIAELIERLEIHALSWRRPDAHEARDANSEAEIIAEAALALRQLTEWKPIESAPRDGTPIWVWAPPAHGLSAMHSLCAYHPDAGFCIDELRDPTHWRPLPIPPQSQ